MVTIAATCVGFTTLPILRRRPAGRFRIPLQLNGKTTRATRLRWDPEIERVWVVPEAMKASRILGVREPDSPMIVAWRTAEASGEREWTNAFRICSRQS